MFPEIEYLHLDLFMRQTGFYWWICPVHNKFPQWKLFDKSFENFAKYRKISKKNICADRNPLLAKKTFWCGDNCSDTEVCLHVQYDEDEKRRRQRQRNCQSVTKKNNNIVLTMRLEFPLFPVNGFISFCLYAYQNN